MDIEQLDWQVDDTCIRSSGNKVVFYVDGDGTEFDVAVACRIAACLNACKGIPTDDLERWGISLVDKIRSDQMDDFRVVEWLEREEDGKASLHRIPNADWPAWARSLQSALFSYEKTNAVLTSADLMIGGRYNWKGQPERLVYAGNNWSGNGFWHQFEKVDEPGIVWCEVRDSDLEMMEATK